MTDDKTPGAIPGVNVPFPVEVQRQRAIAWCANWRRGLEVMQARLEAGATILEATTAGNVAMGYTQDLALVGATRWMMGHNLTDAPPSRHVSGHTH